MLFDQVNLGKIGWTNLQFSVTAPTTNVLLQIGFRDDPTFLGLDDVSLLPLELVLQNVTQTNSAITFSWTALPGAIYQIQTTTNLAQTNWTNLGSVITATNFTVTNSESISASSAQFYRIVLLP